MLYSLGRWGVDFMVTADGSDAFRSGWFTFATENFLADTDPAAPEVTIGLNATDAAPVHIVVGHGEVELRKGPAPDPGLTLAGEPRLIMGVLSGKLSVDRGPRRRPVRRRRPRRPRPRRPRPPRLIPSTAPPDPRRPRGPGSLSRIYRNAYSGRFPTTGRVFGIYCPPPKLCP